MAAGVARAAHATYGTISRIRPLQPVSFRGRSVHVGTNHVLPTGGAARYTGGLSVFDCVRVLTHQELTPAGAELVRPWATVQARRERLDGHAKSAYLRGPDATLANYDEATFDLSDSE